MNLNPILDKITLIRSNQDVLARSNGAKFNVFEVLGVTTDETRLHSALIAELLNPKGSHSQGDLYLRLFIEDLCNDHFPDFTTADALVETEYNIAGAAAGRIDVLVREANARNPRAILIENKIYAGDQDFQLGRYHQHGHSQYREGGFVLFYLTLDGHEPEDFSIKSKSTELTVSKDFFLLSYRDDMLKWLSHCHKESAALPGIRETLAQYISLVSDLSGKSNPFETVIKLESLITVDKTTLEAIIDLRSSLKELLLDMQEKFWRSLFQELSKQYTGVAFYHQHAVVTALNRDLIRNYYEGTRNNMNYGIMIDLNALENYHLKLKIELGEKLWYGITAYDLNQVKWENLLKGDNLPEKIRTLRKHLLEEHRWASKELNYGWLAWKYPSKNIRFREKKDDMGFIADFHNNGIDSVYFISLMEDLSTAVEVIHKALFNQK